ncbi:High-affinity heme uptake system protein IsdE [Lysinibacillus sphaericus]|uniref:High-affinity heme uptake system protein IsdE n=1 Tax=Lysinibacillus sphaericus TaxID=1421 RepID=A0A2S5D2K9_LYSSH|nr:ABC transporter substrate-binding protein [Lysinibacillus sphaericus]POZ57320.1 High-affinity heme uptake system protein IsdE [Lysinibacillus sphaericus]
MKNFTFLLICALALSLAACGEKSTTEDVNASADKVETEQQVQSSGAITLIDDLGNKHEFEATPNSVATLHSGVMDILLALGANVTGRPTISYDIGADVAAIQEIGNPHEPSFEQIAALNAEVLIVPQSFQQFATTVEATGTKVVYSTMNSVDDIKNTIEKYGMLFNNTTAAEKLVAQIDEKIAESAAQSKLDALIVYGAPGTYLAALDNSLYGDILNKAGGKNIAADLPATDKYPTYANLSVEKIVERNPKVIMLITHANPASVKEGFEKQLKENAAWKNLDAVKNNQIIILPSEVFDNPGTEVIEAIDYMRGVLKTAEEAVK